MRRKAHGRPRTRPPTAKNPMRTGKPRSRYGFPPFRRGRRKELTQAPLTSSPAARLRDAPRSVPLSKTWNGLPNASKPCTQKGAQTKFLNRRKQGLPLCLLAGSPMAEPLCVLVSSVPFSPVQTGPVRYPHEAIARLIRAKNYKMDAEELGNRMERGTEASDCPSRRNPMAEPSVPSVSPVSSSCSKLPVRSPSAASANLSAQNYKKVAQSEYQRGHGASLNCNALSAR